MKTLSKVAAFVIDNCATNHLFTTLANKHFVGCASHRFNLAVQDIYADSQSIIAKVNTLMKKLRTPICAAKLRQRTDLKAKCNNETRWSSVAAMLKRYCELENVIENFDINGLDDLVP